MDRAWAGAYNHALGKLRSYQELILRTMWNEEPSAPSVRELEEAEEASRRESRGQEAEEASGGAPPAAVPAAPPAAAHATARATTDAIPDDDDDDNDDEVPLAARRRKEVRKGAASPRAPAPAPIAFAFKEGQAVEVLIGDEWRAGRIDDVNEEEGVYDVVMQEGEDEEGVAVNRLRAP